MKSSNRRGDGIFNFFPPPRRAGGKSYYNKHFFVVSVVAAVAFKYSCWRGLIGVLYTGCDPGPFDECNNFCSIHYYFSMFFFSYKY